MLERGGGTKKDGRRKCIYSLGENLLLFLLSRVHLFVVPPAPFLVDMYMYSSNSEPLVGF